MKRFMSFLLIMAIVLTVIPVYASAGRKPLGFPDVSADAYFADSAKDLLELGILSGDENGNFNGENNITRAEMAAIVCRVLKKSSKEIESAKENNRFNDVNPNHWASGYINVAAKEGIVNGNGYSFRPDDNVLVEEAIKMTVCTMEYGDKVVVNKDDWAKGYIEIAHKLGITDGIRGKKGEQASRADVAVMINNGLDTKDTDSDGFNDFEDLMPDYQYKEPVILVHGLISDTDSTFGVKTKLSASNDMYFAPTENPVSEQEFTSPQSHRIIDIKSDGLGYYLKTAMLYTENKNLFAFNYPNQDVIQFNGERLKKYTEGLIDEFKKSENADDYKYFFPTEAAKTKGEVRFILIGHSMGGLVSRYYIENLGADCVSKLITIDTPHYGSPLALGFLAGTIPAVADLNPESALFGGAKLQSGSSYAVSNQSPALGGNKNISVGYYAIAGYNASAETSLEYNFNDKISPFKLVGLDRSSKDAFKATINKSLTDKYGGSSLLQLGDGSGDSVVNYMSQLAVRFNSDGTCNQYQRIDGAYMIINTKSINDLFHSYINTIPETYKCINEFIDD